MKETKGVALRDMEIRQEITINADRTRVFRALTEGIGYWWGAPYLLSPDGTESLDIILEPRIDGRVYESWGDDEGALWGRITYIRKDESLEITGTVGMAGAIHGRVEFQLKDADGGTVIALHHSAVGLLGGDTEKSYDDGWTDLMSRLKTWVETGKAAGIRA